ncbi:hypothetical protein CEE39_00765 [bacterium (candidate division B38) B3_B38]|nr:MAG: hypothetical protein CEE39_00765 [bacterium (candidate division B38) B3_B38]
MKSLTKAMVIGGLAIAFLSIFYYKNSSSALMRPYCDVSFSMENQDRYCYGDDLEAECGDECWPWPDGPLCHTAPFGNWGIRSNIQDKWDDHQFQGWHWNSTWHHWDWNSCTVKHHIYGPPSECDEYYNYDADPWGMCWQQKTSKGINTYGGGHRGIDIDREEWDDG